MPKYQENIGKSIYRSIYSSKLITDLDYELEQFSNPFVLSSLKNINVSIWRLIFLLLK